MSSKNIKRLFIIIVSIVLVVVGTLIGISKTRRHPVVDDATPEPVHLWRE